jgi:hypothetical protein
MRRQRNITLGLLCILGVLYLASAKRNSSDAASQENKSSGVSAANAALGDASAEFHSITDDQSRLLSLPPPNEEYNDTDTLILVPGHGVFRGLNAEDWRKEELWGLEPFQQGFDGFLIKAFSQHIKRSLEELKGRGTQRSLVVFSGGQTKKAGPRSEGLSYYILAEANNLFDVFSDEAKAEVLMSRLFAEEFARDSYENLLFSICRFYEVVGRYPSNIVVVNWEYKRERFQQYHRAAVRWPMSSFEYIGIDLRDAAAMLGLEVPRSMRELSDGGTLKRVKEDLYLCRANAQLRVDRNPQRRVVPYVQSNPAIRKLLFHCGPDLFDEKHLPWG